jgi:hypothetical protein
MSLFWTIVVASVFFLIAIALISSGLILMGKSRIRGGSCSRVPTKKKDDCEPGGCDLCSKPKMPDDKKE